MATASYRPDLYVGVAFNADPFDVNATPTWIDLTSRVYQINSAKRGRQYELDRNQTGALSIDWHNADEALNPANTGSPYSPNVLPYRQILVRAMWPNGGVGNLLNLAYNSTDASFESYTNGAAAPSWLTAVGSVTATVTTTNPQQGTQCITYTVSNGVTVQGLSWVVPCIPGRQYTASGYVRQTSASTQQIKIVGGATGSSTTTTGAYVRLTVTFTATQPTHTVQLSTTGTAVAGTVNLDALQCEPGASASAFTTTGPLIRNIWTRGYVERWPLGWVDGGFRGISATPGIGPLGILANANLHTEIRNAIMAKKPDYFWGLQEDDKATTFAETSGNNGPPLVKTNSPAGAGPTFAPGTDMNVVGDVGGTGVRTAPTPGNEALINVPDTILQLGYTGRTLVGPSAAAGSTTNWGASCAFVMTRPAGAFSANILFVRFTDFTNNGPVGLIGTAPGQVFSTYGGSFVTDAWGDNKPHLFVITTTMAAPNVTTVLYVDGVQISTNTSAASALAFPVLAVNIGGGVTYTFAIAGQDQTVSNLAYWNRALTSGEATDLGNAFKGYAGETESTRIARYLAYAGYTGPQTLQTGASVMGPGTVNEGDAVLDSCQQASDSAFGNFFEDANGLSYSSRFDRYQRAISSYTFGERIDLGEYPYEDDLTYDLDPTLVLNIADVTRSGGVKAHAEDTTGVSQKRYGKKNFTRTIDIASDNETVDAATWTVSNRKDPHLRVAAVTFQGSRVAGLTAADGTLWPMLLLLEIGTRVTVKRRPKAANAGAGITMSADFFVENIEHHGINPATGDWQTTLLLSPVNVAQPWILENATYGVLDSTTVLGF